MMRDNRTDGLFEALEEEGCVIEERHPGVYYVKGIVGIPMQILITSELNPELHTSLRLLTKRATEADVENFIEMAKSLTEPGDRRNADALLQVSVSANKEVYENVKRRNPVMCEALRDLMKEEIQEEKQEAIDTSLIAATKNLMKKTGWTATQAMESLAIPAPDQIRYAARL